MNIGGGAVVLATVLAATVALVAPAPAEPPAAVQARASAGERPQPVVDDFVPGPVPNVRADLRHSKRVAPLAATFGLHSRPGASRTIYLDFDGYDLPKSSLWASDGYRAKHYDGYDLGRAAGGDGDPATFSSAEQVFVQQVWAGVAEDYAPFDVDVTTEEPPLHRLRRLRGKDHEYGMWVAIVDPASMGGDGSDGVAYDEVFGDQPESDRYFPAWVYPAVPSTGAYVAAVVSHEVGHTLSLVHDGDGHTEYYAGQGIWFPIMGSGLLPLSQWSTGEYAGAVNETKSLQDDVAILARQLGRRPDDHADHTSGATSLGAGASLGGEGVIESREDRDVFVLTRSCSSSLTVAAEPIEQDPNLDIRLRILDATGSEVAVADPPSGMEQNGDESVATGLDATATVPSAIGTYYVEVDGVGQGNPRTDGYSDYGSLGGYTVTANGCAGDTAAPPPPLRLQARPHGPHAATLSWSAPANDGGSTVTGYDVRVDGSKVTSTSGTAYDLSGLDVGAHRVTVSARNGVGASQPTALSFSTHRAEVPKGASGPSRPRGVRATDGIRQSPGRDIVVMWQPPKTSGGLAVSGYRLVATRLDRRGHVIGRRTHDVGGGTLFLWQVGKGRYQVRVQARNALGYGPLSAASQTVTAR